MTASHDTATGAWIGVRHAVGRPRRRLICLPHAGGGVGSFAGWRPHVPEGTELALVELPGRGGRIDEAVPQTMDGLVDALFTGLRAEFDAPYAVFGHSFGALLGYELTRRIERAIVQGEPLRPPQALLVSGSRAPHVPLHRKRVADGDDAQLIAWLRGSGGLPEELLAFPDFLSELLRAVRSDMSFAERYLIPEPEAIDCPLVAFAGSQDAVSAASWVEPWSQYTTAAHRLRVLPGGHYFPQSHPQETVTAVLAELTAVSGY